VTPKKQDGKGGGFLKALRKGLILTAHYKENGVSLFRPSL
jgi:hypothetical protein